MGEYEIRAKLGQGAFGAVFRGVHPLIGKEVAIKVLARRFSVDPEMVSRFVAEARAVNQIRHRNIIDIFAFGQLDDGRHYYVMEYVDGEPLDALIERRGRLPLAEALPLLRSIARALDAAHAKGIAHRDLKAENIFLGTDPDGGDGLAVWPKLLDFGIAKLLGADDGLKHKTRTGTPVGTPHYMSPEQCRGRDVDPRTDLYAFGVLAYLMLTGRFPLDADDFMSVLIRQMTDQPEPASSLVPELPAGVDEAIAWLMQKDPADRPTHLREAIAALEAAAAGAGVAVPAPSAVWDVPSAPVGRVTPVAMAAATPTAVAASTGARPKRKLAAIVAGVAIAAIAAVVLATRGGGDEPASGTRAAAASGSGTAEADGGSGTAEAASGSGTAAADGGSGTAEAASGRGTAPAPVPAHVIITVAGTPKGTEVRIAGALVGVAPGPVQLPRGTDPVVLTFALAGHVAESRTLTPDADQQLTVKLQRRGGGRPKRPSGKDDIIDVFGGKP